MTVRVRFAPSPTGFLHVGNIRTALVNFLFAKKQGGEFLLRLDDTDKERSLQKFEDAILEDLIWLGMKWDGDMFRESERFARYDEAKAQLIAAGRLYACYETAEELEFKRKMLSGRGLPPIYDRAALKLTDEQKAKHEAEGRKPHWRFLLADGDIVWNDMIRGEVRINARTVSDPVLVRADGIPLYTFCSVVDDIDYNISHILRGEDHVTNTAVQTQIFTAMGSAIPTFGHMALIKTKDGELSKRTGGGDIRSLREEGLEAMAINSLLARLGTSDPIEPIAEMSTLIAAFDISKFGRAPANYDQVELERLNGKIVQQLPFGAVQQKLSGSAVDEAFWNSVRGNLHKISEAKDWWNILHQPIAAPANDDADYTKQAAELYPAAWSDNSFSEWTNAVKEKTGRKGKELFMPLRRALTGREDGPELKAVLALLPREKAIARLRGEAA